MSMQSSPPRWIRMMPAVAVLLIACPPGRAPDDTPGDAGSNHAGPAFDAGSSDAGPAFDAGSSDAGPAFDAGSSDAGPAFDAGSSDAGPGQDAGPADASLLSCPILAQPDAGEAPDAAALTGTVPVVLHVESPSTNPLQPFSLGVDGEALQQNDFDGGVDLTYAVDRSQLDALLFGLASSNPDAVWERNFPLASTLAFLAIDSSAVASITIVVNEAPAPSFVFGIGPIEVALSDGGTVTTPQEPPEPPAAGSAPLTNQNAGEWIPVIVHSGYSWSQASVVLTGPPPDCALLSLQEQVESPNVSTTELLECPLWALSSLEVAGLEVYGADGGTLFAPFVALGSWLQAAGACPAQAAWIQFGMSAAFDLPATDAVVQLEAVLDDGTALTASQNLPDAGDAGG